jgi:hypothetical protein
MKYFHDDTYYQHYLTAPRTHGSYSDSTNFLQDWLVQHVEWKSQKQVGFLSFTNEYGDPQMDMVDENFEVPSYAKRVNTNEFNVQKVSYVWNDTKGIEYKFEWGWIPEVWQGVRIGEDIYCMIGPKEYQIRSLENPYDIKLGYHGVIYNSMNAVSVSVMDRMKPFQYLYFIVTHKLKKLIAQDKGRIFHLDTTMIDPKIGLEKTLYYLQNLNIEFYNPLQNADQPGWSQRGKVSGSTDLSVSDQIMNYVQLLAAIDQQISDVAGVNRQREGQTAPNEAVTNSQSNIAMSSMVTEVYFQAHNKLWERILNSLMDVAEICFKNKSLVKQWVLDDQSLATLEFTPDSLTNASFGVFVVDSPKEQQVFDQLQALGQAMIQNDKATLSDWIKVLEGTSTQQLKRSILQSEKDAQTREQQNMQAQMEAANQAQEKEHQFQLELQAREIEGKIAIAQIESFKFMQDQDADNDGIPDQFEIEKFKTEAALKSRKLNLEAESLKIQREKNAQDKDLKEKDLKIKSRKSSTK